MNILSCKFEKINAREFRANAIATGFSYDTDGISISINFKISGEEVIPSVEMYLLFDGYKQIDRELYQKERPQLNALIAQTLRVALADPMVHELIYGNE